MANEIPQQLPTEVLVTPESLEAQIKQLRSGVESHAQDCADYTQYFFTREGKDFNAFIQEVAQEPFNIVIDPKSPTSIATGIFDLQHLLGMRLKPGYKNSCDGKFGPNTNKEYEKARDSYKLNAANKAKIKDLHAAVQPTIESNNTLPETPISKTLFVGDSLTVGMEAVGGINGSLRPEKYDHKVVIDKKTGKPRDVWKGIAIGGQQTTAMLNAVKHAEDAHELEGGERMVVWGGVNDIASARSPEAIIKTLTEIYTLAGKHNMSIVACTISPWQPTEKTMKSFNARWMKNLNKPYPYTAEQLVQNIEKVNTWIRTQAATTVPGKQFSVVDLNTEVATKPKEYPQISDNLHFTVEASKKIAAYIRSRANIA